MEFDTERVRNRRGEYVSLDAGRPTDEQREMRNAEERLRMIE